jgi:hypothetical protein
MANWPVLSGADDAAFAQQNLLQTEKADRDGQIPMTGVFQPDMGATVTPAAGVLTLGNDGNYFAVAAGNFSTIVQLAVGGAAVQPGTVVKLHFNGVSVITHSADIVLPGAANITSVAGDEAEFICYAAGDWRCTKYQRLTDWQDLRTTDGPTFNHLYVAGAGGVVGLAAGADMAVNNPTNQSFYHVGGVQAYNVLDNQTVTFTVGSGIIFTVCNTSLGLGGAFFAGYKAAVIILSDPGAAFVATDTDSGKIAVFKTADSTTVSIKNYTNATITLVVNGLGVIGAATAPA